MEWLLTYRVKLKLASIKGKSKADINTDNISDLKNGTRWALVLEFGLLASERSERDTYRGNTIYSPAVQFLSKNSFHWLIKSCDQL